MAHNVASASDTQTGTGPQYSAWSLERPRRVLGSGSCLGVGGRRYVVCHEVPPVPERCTGSAPAGAVRPCPVRVEPRPGAAPDVGTVERTHAGLERPGRTVDCCPGCGAVAGCRISDGPA